MHVISGYRSRLLISSWWLSILTNAGEILCYFLVFSLYLLMCVLATNLLRDILDFKAEVNYLGHLFEFVLLLMITKK